MEFELVQGSMPLPNIEIKRWTSHADAVYRPDTNTIYLGAFEDNAMDRFCAEVVSHEMAHWAQFVFLTEREQKFSTDNYAGGHESLLEKMAYYASFDCASDYLSFVRENYCLYAENLAVIIFNERVK